MEMMVVLNAMAIMAIVVVLVEGGMMIEVEQREEEEEEEVIQIMDAPMPILDGVVLPLVEVMLVVEERLTHAMVALLVVVVEVMIDLVLETVAVIVVVVVTLLVGEEEVLSPLETRLAPCHLLRLREIDHV